MSDKPYAIIDRDGTIIAEKDYLSDPNEIELLPNAVIGMMMLNAAGYGIIIATNQSGIGRGYYSKEEYQRVEDRLLEILQEQHVKIDTIYYCPHTPDDECDCRKPSAGMIEKAIADLAINPKDCVVIGDKPADINLGKAVHAKSILVRTGYGKEHEINRTCTPDFIADDLEDAAEWILSQKNDS